MEAPTLAIKREQRPDAIGPQAKIRDEGEAEQALRELAFLTSYEAEVNATRNVLHQQVDELADAALVLSIGAQSQTVAERREKILSGLQAFVSAEHPTLRSGGDGKRTLKLDYGELSWTKSRDSVQFAKGKTEKDVLHAVDRVLSESEPDEPKTLRERVVSWLERVRFCWEDGTKAVALIVDLKPQVKRSELLKRYDAGKLTAALLARFGLRHVEGGDVFNAKPKPWQPGE